MQSDIIRQFKKSGLTLAQLSVKLREQSGFSVSARVLDRAIKGAPAPIYDQIRTDILNILKGE